MNKKKVAGITLIEVMIAAAVIVILAAIAYPAYQNQVNKSRRTEARSALANLALAQERFFTVNGSYALGTTALPLSGLDLAAGLTANQTTVTTEQGLYTITLDAGATATSFVANAAATGQQAGDTACSWMAISHLGVKTANNAVCW